MGMSNLTVMGNITRDIELRYTQSGKAVTDICVAINEKRGNNESVVFLDCTVWEKTAELCDKYLKKGDQVLFTGRLFQDTWEDKNGGGKRTKIKMIVSGLTFVNNKDNKEGKTSNSKSTPKKEPNDGFGDNEEIPF